MIGHASFCNKERNRECVFILGRMKKFFGKSKDSNRQEDLDILLNDERYGATREEREAFIKKAQRCVKWLDIIAVMLSVSLIVPIFYVVQVSLCLLLPWVCWCIVKYFKGIVRIDGNTKSAYPMVFASILLPTGALALRIMSDFSFFGNVYFWVTISMVFLVCFFLFVFGIPSTYNFRHFESYLSVLGFAFLLAMYSYDFVLTTNMFFSESKSIKYKARVLDKRISSGRRATSYYLKLSSWGDQENGAEESVSEDMYNRKAIGDTAVIYLKTGLYNIPFYRVMR